ncbi:4513_t:CDS:2 [Gigaspora margarita]|uniref:4513_t:CDS:1 n=1 Tax=Gigaspora margarita TaxID=4874 RepID=A0ABN7VUR0_GIGMA|nr:4513_t:CDS:2 [Gigaspora margarita]
MDQYIDSSFLSQNDFGNDHLFANAGSYNTFDLSTDSDQYITFNIFTNSSPYNIFNLFIDASNYNNLTTDTGPLYNPLLDVDNLKDDFGNDFLSINDVAARDNFRNEYISGEISLDNEPISLKHNSIT